MFHIHEWFTSRMVCMLVKLKLTSLYVSINLKLQHPPGNSRAFDETLCPGAGNLTLGVPGGSGIEPKGMGEPSIWTNNDTISWFCLHKSVKWKMAFQSMPYSIIYWAVFFKKIEEFSSTLIIKQKLSWEWKEQQLIWMKKSAQTYFFLSCGRGHLNTNRSTWPDIWPKKSCPRPGRGGEFDQQRFQKFKYPGMARGDVEVWNWLIHYIWTRKVN